MSKNESEQGQIKIPLKIWSSFKKKLVKANNIIQDETLLFAKKIGIYLKTENKGKRNISFYKELEELFSFCDVVYIDESKLNTSEMKMLGISASLDYSFKRSKLKINMGNISDSQYETIVDLLIKDNKLIKPKKKVLEYANNKTSEINVDGYANILFDNNNNTVYWTVFNNNHAVDNARKSKIGFDFFQELKKIDFTKNTGGVIYGNDEFNINDGDGQEYETSNFNFEK